MSRSRCVSSVVCSSAAAFAVFGACATIQLRTTGTNVHVSLLLSTEYTISAEDKKNTSREIAEMLTSCFKIGMLAQFGSIGFGILAFGFLLFNSDRSASCPSKNCLCCACWTEVASCRMSLVLVDVLKQPSSPVLRARSSCACGFLHQPMRMPISGLERVEADWHTHTHRGTGWHAHTH